MAGQSSLAREEGARVLHSRCRGPVSTAENVARWRRSGALARVDAGVRSEMKPATIHGHGHETVSAEPITLQHDEKTHADAAPYPLRGGGRRFTDVPFTEIDNRFEEVFTLVPNDWKTVAARLRAPGVL